MKLCQIQPGDGGRGRRREGGRERERGEKERGREGEGEGGRGRGGERVKLVYGNGRHTTGHVMTSLETILQGKWSSRQ